MTGSQDHPAAPNPTKSAAHSSVEDRRANLRYWDLGTLFGLGLVFIRSFLGPWLLLGVTVSRFGAIPVLGPLIEVAADVLLVGAVVAFANTDSPGSLTSIWTSSRPAFVPRALSYLLLHALAATLATLAHLTLGFPIRPDQIGLYATFPDVFPDPLPLVYVILSPIFFFVPQSSVIEKTSPLGAIKSSIATIYRRFTWFLALFVVNLFLALGVSLLAFLVMWTSGTDPATLRNVITLSSSSAERVPVTAFRFAIFLISSYMCAVTTFAFLVDQSDRKDALITP